MVHPCRGFNQGTTACSLACVNATCAERTLAPPTIGGGGQRDKQGVTRREQAIERLPHGIQSRLLRRINSLFIRHFPQASSVWRQARSCRMATCAQVQHGIGAASWRPFFSDAPDISGFRRGRRSALRGRRYRYGVLKPSVGGVAPTYNGGAEVQWRCRSFGHGGTGRDATLAAIPFRRTRHPGVPAHENPRHRLGRARTRAGVEAGAVAARGRGHRRAGQRRHRDRGQMPQRGGEGDRSRRPAGAGAARRRGADRGRAGRAAGGGRGGPLPRRRAAHLRADRRRRAARRQQGLRQGFPRPARDSHRVLRRAYRRGRGAGLRARRFHQERGRTHRDQGRRAGRRQGRDRGDDAGRGRGRGARHAFRQRLRRRRRAGGDRGVPRWRGGQLHLDGGRQNRVAARHQPGPQARRRRRHRPQHRWHGRVFARAGGHAGTPRADHARGGGTDRGRHGRRRRAVHRLPLRRADDRRQRRAQSDRVQRALRRSGNPADPDAAGLGFGRPSRGGHRWPPRRRGGAVGSARCGRRGDGLAALSRSARHRRGDFRSGCRTRAGQGLPRRHRAGCAGPGDRQRRAGAVRHRAGRQRRAGAAARLRGRGRDPLEQRIPPPRYLLARERGES